MSSASEGLFPTASPSAPALPYGMHGPQSQGTSGATGFIRAAAEQCLHVTIDAPFTLEDAASENISVPT